MANLNDMLAQFVLDAQQKVGQANPMNAALAHPVGQPQGPGAVGQVGDLLGNLLTQGSIGPGGIGRSRKQNFDGSYQTQDQPRGLDWLEANGPNRQSVKDRYQGMVDQRNQTAQDAGQAVAFRKMEQGMGDPNAWQFPTDAIGNKLALDSKGQPVGFSGNPTGTVQDFGPDGATSKDLQGNIANAAQQFQFPDYAPPIQGPNQAPFQPDKFQMPTSFPGVNAGPLVGPDAGMFDGVNSQPPSQNTGSDSVWNSILGFGNKAVDATKDFGNNFFGGVVPAMSLAGQMGAAQAKPLIQQGMNAVSPLIDQTKRVGLDKLDSTLRGIRQIEPFDILFNPIDQMGNFVEGLSPPRTPAAYRTPVRQSAPQLPQVAPAPVVPFQGWNQRPELPKPQSRISANNDFSNVPFNPIDPINPVNSFIGSFTGAQAPSASQDPQAPQSPAARPTVAQAPQAQPAQMAPAPSQDFADDGHVARLLRQDLEDTDKQLGKAGYSQYNITKAMERARERADEFEGGSKPPFYDRIQGAMDAFSAADHALQDTDFNAYPAMRPILEAYHAKAKQRLDAYKEEVKQSGGYKIPTQPNSAQSDTGWKFPTTTPKSLKRPVENPNLQVRPSPGYNFTVPNLSGKPSKPKKNNYAPVPFS